MSPIDVQRSTPLRELLLHNTASPIRRDNRVHISAEAKTNLPWNSIVTSQPIPDWKAYYTFHNTFTGDTYHHEVGLFIQMLAWDLPAAVLMNSTTNTPFYYRSELSPIQGTIPNPYFPPPFPEKHSLSLAGKDTIFLGLEIAPYSRSHGRPVMRSMISRERSSTTTRHSSLLLIDPVGQKSLQLRTTYHNNETDQAVKVVITGKTTSPNSPDLDFQTRIVTTQNDRGIEYLFGPDGRLMQLKNEHGQSIPIQNPLTFTQHTLGLKDAILNHAQTLRGLWMNAGRQNPYSPFHKLVAQKSAKKVEVGV